MRWNRSACGVFVMMASVTAAGLVGCDAPLATFEPNRIYEKRTEMLQDVDLSQAEADIQVVLERLFGTPDQPLWPAVLAKDERTDRLVSMDSLQRAAGPIRSDEADVHFGLYREHCVSCHAVSGDGRGPTSRLLNPYPRDFRPGNFKFKSTPIGSKPTRSDLSRLLGAGIPGTSMPAFHLIKEEDREALVDYVMYLSIRGEVERKLIDEVAFELDYESGDRLFDPGLQDRDPPQFAEQWQVIEGIARKVALPWAEAESAVPGVTGPPEGFPIYGEIADASSALQEQLVASVARGRAVYEGKIANCASCHGPTGLGDGQIADYDEWTKEWTTSVGLDPKDKQALEPMLELGALKPRHSLPRNLRTGIMRGGSRPLDLYYRIVHGIEGTPMPAAAMQPANSLGLTERDVWDLVNYLLSLPHEDTGPIQTSGVPSEQLTAMATSEGAE